jgi:hypothetical protein
MHQQRSGLLPVALAFSAAQTLGSWQMGHAIIRRDPDIE